VVITNSAAECAVLHMHAGPRGHPRVVVTDYPVHQEGGVSIAVADSKDRADPLAAGGTFIGLQAAVRAPEMFAVYIGVAQIVHQLKSEMLAYEYLLRQFRQADNRSMIRKL
jgi:hypothetical protein